MPWYWSDEIAKVLVSVDAIDEQAALVMSSPPVAIRREEVSVEEATTGMLEDGEIPLAA